MTTDTTLTAVHDFARSKMRDDETGHGFDHIQRVVRLADELLKAYPQADRLLTLSAAYLHDVIDEKLVTDTAAASAEVRDFLTAQGFSADQQATIFLIMDNMSFHKTLDGTAKPLPLEGQLVQDADRLDAIGAIGIARAIYFGGHFGEKIYDPAVAPRTQMSHAEYRNLGNETVINHFYEKLLTLKDLMNTDAAKTLAAHRQAVMKDFLAEFKAEWRAEK
ncbi:HD domain-containing protein [Levilactobacillus namurensis]|uniref:HD domain-containing protein n=1 Tax=Levilactobacillus namurensis TaxID=380393 RepID=UPI00223291C6|nr:HD domain-containing protein [Levilactobacillus namurensis]MCW3778331.1 HD domain-containing protein [Levilactobacillus namurensis]MDT7019665.1 HD domain-containing protein [Levilactobacillus namurensis]WNN65744.1 HD domain-containing protein [Levilactobacillus namurensis]